MRTTLILSLVSTFVITLSVLNANASPPPDYTAETSEVTSAMNNLVVDQSLKYCQAGTLNCRDMVLLKDQTTGAPTREIFYDNFVSSARKVASTGYFLKNVDGTYRSRMDTLFDGQLAVTFVEPLNANLVITFDAAGFPTFHDVTLKRLGTSRKIIATMAYGPTECVITGTEYDELDPSFRETTITTYVRVP